MTKFRRNQRAQSSQIVLEVVERIQLTPHMVRIIAGGPGIAAVEDKGFTDSYTKMVFPHPGTDLEPPYDFDFLRERLPIDLMPSVRTYTIRRFDLTNGHIWIDFVVHGDQGVAGPWAQSAKPCDPIVLAGIGGNYSPDPRSDWHLLLGDDSALPAIAAALESMQPNAEGFALLEVDGFTDHVELSAPEGIRLQWLHRKGREAGTTTLLNDAVRSMEWPAGNVQVFAHGERAAMKTIRPYLTDERGIDRSQLSLSAYWAHGRKEEAFQSEKREVIGQI